MKRLLTISLSVFMAVAVCSLSQAANKQTKVVKAKQSPCATDCQKENTKCKGAAKKGKKAELKVKTAECDKTFKNCKDNCNKPAPATAPAPAPAAQK